jgi:hypothetical protein
LNDNIPFHQTAFHVFSVTQQELGQLPTVVVPEEWTDSLMLGAVIRFMQKIAKEPLPPQGAYLGRQGQLRLLPLGKDLRQLLKVPPDLLLDKFHQHYCHPLVGAYLRALETIQTFRIESLSGEPAEVVAAFALVLQRLHSEVQAKDLRHRIQNFRRNARKCHAGLIKMIRMITSKHSKVLSLRQDLSYLAAHPDSGRKHPSSREAKAHLAKFLVHLRRKTGLKVIGYCWSMEYAPTTGCHFHFWLFLNGHHHQDALRIGHQLGEAWRMITDGEGRDYLCNRDQKRYAHLAVGMLHRESLDWVGIEHTAAYITHPDYYLQYHPKDGGRTFGRAIMP